MMIRGDGLVLLYQHYMIYDSIVYNFDLYDDSNNNHMKYWVTIVIRGILMLPANTVYSHPPLDPVC